MWRFHRYYLREMLVNLGMTFFMLFGIAMLALLARGITRTQGTGMFLALKVTVLWAVDIVPDLLAISTLIATVFTFSRAAADNEITAIRMSGVSPLRLLGSVLIVGTLTAGLNTYLVHNLIPTVHFLKYRPVKEAAKQFAMNLRPSNNRIAVQDRLIMSWQRVEDGKYVDVNIKAVGGNLAFEGFAKRVWFESDQSDRNVYLRLESPEGYQSSAMGDEVQARSVVKLRKGAVFTIKFDLNEILEKGKRAEGIKDLSTAQLVAELERDGSENAAVARWTVWDRTFKGFASLLLALTAFPIGVLSRRSGRMAALSMSSVPLTLYYGVFYLARPIARATDALWPVALPSIVMLGLTWILMRLAFRV